MSTDAYRLPDLLVLVPEKPGGEINPHFKAVEAAFNAWVEKTFGKATAMEVLKCNTPLFNALLYPLASYEQLRKFFDYCAMGFLLDDILDSSPAEDVSAFSQLWMKTLRNENEAEDTGHPLIEIMRRELMPGTTAAMGAFHWPQFIAANEDMVAQMVQEAHGRRVYLSQNTFPGIQQFLMQRRSTSGAYPQLAIARISRRLYIPEDVLVSPIVQEMVNSAVDMLVISNDIYSFKKEYQFDRAFGNILTAIEKGPETAHLDFQGRLDHAEQLFQLALEKFHACKRELPSFGPEVDEYLVQYADAMMDMIVGNLEWSRVTGRYKTFVNDEDRENNVMRMTWHSSSANEAL